MRIRWYTKDDLGNVLDIGREVYGKWFTSDVVDGLQLQRTASILLCDITEGGDTHLGGWAAYRLEDDHVWLSSMVVARAHRRKGVGSALLKKLMMKQSYRRPVLAAVVPEVCLDGQLFLRSMGLTAVGLNRDHFQWADGRAVDGITFMHDMVPIKAPVKVVS